MLGSRVLRGKNWRSFDIVVLPDRISAKTNKGISRSNDIHTVAGNQDDSVFRFENQVLTVGTAR